MAAGFIDTREALIRSGKREFLEHGFEKASLRAICSRAHVTTGAFYAHFASKADLFSTIVERDLAEYHELYDGLLSRLTLHVNRADDNENLIMDYIMEHQDLFKLLFDCSQGTPYEGFKDELLAKFDRTYQSFFDSYAPGMVSQEVTRVIVRMKFAQYLEMMYGDYSRDEVRLMTARLGEFTQAGFQALLHVDFEGPGDEPGPSS